MPTYKIIQRLFRLLDQEGRRRAIYLVALMVVGAPMELIALSLLYPFVLVLTDLSAAQKNEIFVIASNVVDVADRQDAFLLMASLLVLATMVKGLFFISIIYAQARLLIVEQVSLARRIFGAMLETSQVTRGAQHSSSVLVMITKGIERLFSNGYSPTFVLMRELSIALCVVCFLLIRHPVATLASASLMIALVILVYLPRAKASMSLGQRMNVESERLTRVTGDALGAAKEILLLGCGRYFADRFSSFFRSYAEALQRTSVLIQTPRYIVEMAAAVLVVLVVLTLFWSTTHEADILPSVAVFVAAVFRLIPAVTTIGASVTQIQSVTPILDTLASDFKTMVALPAAEKRASSQPVRFHRELVLRNVSLRHDPAGPLLLDGVNLRIQRGQIVGIIGPSGAGKTTIIDIIAGLVKPTDGMVLADDAPIDLDLSGWQRGIGYVPQHVFLLDDTIRSNVAFGVNSAEIDMGRVSRALHMAHLDAVVSSLAEGVNSRIGERGSLLSAGQGQRIGIARSLYRDPGVLLLDEITAALDAEAEAAIMEMLSGLRGHKTVVVIAHRLNTVRCCDNIYFVEKGRIADSGTFEDLTRHSKRFRSFLEKGGMSSSLSS